MITITNSLNENSRQEKKKFFFKPIKSNIYVTSELLFNVRYTNIKNKKLSNNQKILKLRFQNRLIALVNLLKL